MQNYLSDTSSQLQSNGPTGLMIPTVIVPTSNGGERAADIYSVLLQSRIIHVKRPFESDMASVITAQIQYLEFIDETKKKPIDLYINSVGGEVYALIDIITTLESVKCPIRTFTTGLSASCGSILFNAASPGHRYMGRLARQMAHQPSSGTRGTVTDQEIAMEETKRIKQIMIDYYHERNTAKKSRKEIAEMLERDKWMDAQESIDAGFADHII